MPKPSSKPANPCFSSGPCAKRPGWTPEAVHKLAILGRSHRGELAKAQIFEVLQRSRKILNIPDDYHVALVPASDTGAIEMAMWSLLGPLPIDLLAWENFGFEWMRDVQQQLKLPNVNYLTAPYGEIPDLTQVNPDHDCIFVWNGTTAGVSLPNADWIKDNRQGLTFCDATSSIFGVDMNWSKLDITTWSWQKGLGGEAAHGMLALSPRAMERLQTHIPAWPLPKIFRLMKNGALMKDVFDGLTINTVSMWCVADCLDALLWAEKIGGLPTLLGRTQANFKVIEDWVAKTPWIEFTAKDPATRAVTSVNLSIIDPWFTGFTPEDQRQIVRHLAKKLEQEKVAYDIASHMMAPPGLRFWAGPTVETSDLQTLLPWVEWGYEQLKTEKQAA